MNFAGFRSHFVEKEEEEEDHLRPGRGIGSGGRQQEGGSPG